MDVKHKNLFEPIKIGHMIVKNRIETAPMAPRLANDDGTVSNELLAWTRELAKGGAGIVTVGISQVTPLDGRSSASCVNMGSDHVIPSLTALVEEVHRYDAKASIELRRVFVRARHADRGDPHRSYDKGRDQRMDRHVRIRRGTRACVWYGYGHASRRTRDPYQ